MIEKAKNKMERGEASETKALRPYHFAGEGEYQPQMILAASIGEAEAEYIRTRVPVKSKVEPDQTKEQQ